MKSRIYIGCSGFSNRDWKGFFFPEELPPKEQQKGHHDAAFLDLDHPYEQYKGIHYCCKK